MCVCLYKVSVFIKFSVPLVHGSRMSFGLGIVCLQALQICCDNPPLFGKDIPKLSFPLNLRGGGGSEGLEKKSFWARRLCSGRMICRMCSSFQSCLGSSEASILETKLTASVIRGCIHCLAANV